MDAPLDSLLVFERAPRNDTERRAAQAMLVRTKAGSLLRWPEPAKCVLVSAQAESAALNAPSPGAATGDAHADLDATLVYHCAQPQALRSVDLSALLVAFTRIQRVELQILEAAWQHGKTLKRPETVVRWR